MSCVWADVYVMVIGDLFRLGQGAYTGFAGRQYGKSQLVWQQLINRYVPVYYIYLYTYIFIHIYIYNFFLN